MLIVNWNTCSSKTASELLYCLLRLTLTAWNKHVHSKIVTFLTVVDGYVAVTPSQGSIPQPLGAWIGCTINSSSVPHRGWNIDSSSFVICKSLFPPRPRLQSSLSSTSLHPSPFISAFNVSRNFTTLALVHSNRITRWKYSFMKNTYLAFRKYIDPNAPKCHLQHPD